MISMGDVQEIAKPQVSENLTEGWIGESLAGQGVSRGIVVEKLRREVDISDLFL